MPGKDISPQLLLDELLSRKSRPERVNNLRLLHKICEAQSFGARDFRTAVIGRIFEAAGGIKAKALNNRQSADYQALIGSWRNFSGPAASKKNVNEVLDDAISARISDPALRSVFQNAVSERNRLRAELDLLKSVTMFVVDKRPLSLGRDQAREHSGFGDGLRLTLTERRALAQAVEPEFLASEDWTEGENGEIRKGRRIVFDFGFADAVRKVLAHTEPKAPESPDG